jgi:hypothetical protein
MHDCDDSVIACTGNVIKNNQIPRSGRDDNGFAGMTTLFRIHEPEKIKRARMAPAPLS